MVYLDDTRPVCSDMAAFTEAADRHVGRGKARFRIVDTPIMANGAFGGRALENTSLVARFT